MAKYQAELDKLQSEIAQAATPPPDIIQQQLAEMNQKLSGLSEQVANRPQTVIENQYNINKVEGDIVGRDKAGEDILNAETIHQSSNKNSEKIEKKIDQISDQLSQTKAELVAEHETTRKTLNTHQAVLLAKIGQQHAETLAAIISRLNADQIETVDLLLDVIDKQQVAEWEVAQIPPMIQQALVDLKRLREGQPDAAEWQTLYQIVESDTSWDQKLRWTLPLIPGVLAYDSELNVDLKGALQAAWQRLKAKIGR